jgi:hypothetical protein
MKPTVVTTSIRIAAAPERVWPILCDARLPLTAPCWFRLGVPTPERCRLVAEEGAVGARRQCITSQGQVDQRITEWIPNERLSFAAVGDTIGLQEHLERMEDTFTLDPLPGGGTCLSRTTRFQARSGLPALKSVALRAVVRRIHRYVLRNFKTLAEAGRSELTVNSSPLGSGSRSTVNRQRSTANFLRGVLCGLAALAGAAAIAVLVARSRQQDGREE